MKLEVSGNINETQRSTVFFPGSKFSKAEKNDAETPYANVCVDSTDTCATATVTLGYEGRSVTTSHIELRGAEEKVSAERIACGKAFLEAGKAITGITPSWGILTGVRPAKLATDGPFEREEQSGGLSLPDKGIFG